MKKYIRPVIIVVLLCLLVSETVSVVFHNITQKTLLSVVIIDADRNSTEQFEKLKQQLLETIGTGKAEETVKIDLSATSAESADMEINVVMKLSVVEENDVIICGQEIYEKFHEEGAFAEWGDILEDSENKYQPYIQGDAVLISDIEAWNSGNYVQYEPAYMCVLNSSDKKAEAAQMLKMLCSKSLR